MLNAAFLSFWHVHAHDYARQFLSFPDTRIAAVWDEDPARGREAAARYGAAYCASLDQALAYPGVDCVVVDAPTHLHCEVITRAARAGKHIFTEKVLAPTLAEADAIAAAVQAAGVYFMISFPRRCEPQWMLVKQLVDQGVVGRVTYARARWGHTGASDGWLPAHFFDPVQCGGGALIDLGAHPLYLLRWILGRPARVSARYGAVLTRERGVEDNAVVTLEYASGALAVAEASFVSASPSTLEVHGTEGVILAGLPGHPVQVRSRRWSQALGCDGWVAPALPKPDRSPMQQWIEAIREGKPVHITLADARDLTELAEAANTSARMGRPVDL